MALACLAFLPGVSRAERIERAAELFRMEARSPYEQVSPGDTEYELARDLADGGLLGFSSPVFLNDQPVTRLELAQLTSIMFENFLKWRKTGTVSTQVPESWLKGLDRSRPVTVEEIQRVGQSELEILRDMTTLSVGLESKDTQTLKRKGPALLDVGEGESQQPMAQVEAAVSLTSADVDNLQTLIDGLEKEIANVNKDFKKEFGSLRKVVLRNERDIEKLQDENDRLSIHGTMTGLFSSGQFGEDQPNASAGSGTNNPFTDDMLPGIDFASRLELQLSSKPKKFEDLKLGATLSAVNIFGGDRHRTGLLNGTRSPLQVDELYVNYQNAREESNGRPNIKLRNFRFGDTGVAFSPLTVFGKSVEGMTGTVQIKDYGLDFFGARTQYRPRNSFLAGGALGDFDSFYNFNNVAKFKDFGTLRNEFKLKQYDQYMYGASVQTSLFDVPESLARITKVYMVDDKGSSRLQGGSSFFPAAPAGQTSCEWGQWANLDPEADPFREDFETGSSGLENTELFCLPPEKNSILSAFLRHPIPGTGKKAFVTAEFAHSTYYKPAYRATFPKRTGGEFEYIDTSDPGDEYTSWLQVRERAAQDDAFLFLLDYNRGSSKIFPIGFIHLGANFFTKNPGLPGLDSSGFDIGFLPISIQALDLYLASYEYNNPKSDIKYNFLYLYGKENDPQYFDPGGIMTLLNDRENLTLEIPVLARILDRLNNRTGKLALNVLNAGATYNLDDDITLGYSYTGVNASLPPTCIDGNIIEITDDHGNTVDKFIGNGIANCDDNSPLGEPEDLLVRLNFKLRTNQYKLNWDTSNKGKYGLVLKTDETRLDLNLDPTADPIIKDIVPQGKYYTLDQTFNYQLTDSTNLEFRWQKIWDDSRDNFYLNRQFDFTGYKFLVQTTF